MKNKAHSAAVIFALLACVAAAPEASPTAAPDKKAKGMLRADAIDVMAILPAPPVKGSPEEKGELNEILAVQASRTPEEVARAKAEEKFDVFIFSTVLGSDFNADKCPQTAALFKKLTADGKGLAKVGKLHWDRKRPPYIDDRIKPVVTLEDEGSYPSSHATRGELFAEVLSTAVPAKTDALMIRGHQIGSERIVGGVHYPSDIYAGEVLGHVAFEKLKADAAFETELDGVKTELSQLNQVKVSTR